MVNHFTQKAQNALNRALSGARELGHTYIGTEHLLLGLLAETDSIAARVLESRGVRYDRTRQLIRENAGTGTGSSVSAADMTPRAKKIIENSAYESARAGHGFIGTEHLLLALTGEAECEAVKLISAQGVSPTELRNDITAYFGSGESPSPRAGKTAQRETPRESVRDFPNLSTYGRNLCQIAQTGGVDPVVGREEETERVIRILSRRTKNNPCLIGEPGVGKTAVVEGIAQRIADGSVPDSLRGKMIVMLDLSSMIAGAKYRGEFEERMKGVLAEAAKNTRVILFIDEIHTIIGAGGAEGALDAANILKPALARGELQVIGATTIDEYRRHIERDAALERRFQSVLIREPSPEMAKSILCGLRDRYEAHHRLTITDDAIDAAVRLSSRYICGRYLPDKAIDLIDEAAAKKRLDACMPRAEVREIEDKLKTVSAEKEEAILAEDYEIAASLRDREKRLRSEYDSRRDIAQLPERHALCVTAEDVAQIVTAWTGIPVQQLEKEESERLAELETLLGARVIGQEEAVRAVARATRRGRTGLQDPRRPVGSFLFLGPTGVGKTELARALADIMYGGEDAMIRMDMSEYMEKFTASRLVGSPPGYVGYEEGGQLTERVRRRPYSVVLLDEIEKAHPDVFNLLLQILEDGTLSDAQGRHVDFRNTIIIMTSNVGAAGITSEKRLGFAPQTDAAADYERMKRHVSGALREIFRPEFLNRIDEIIIFGKLSSENIRAIAERMLAELTKRISALGITVRFSEEIVGELAREGFDPAYGARPLRRTIQRRVEDPFSEELLAGRIRAGDTADAVWTPEGIRYTVEQKQK